MASATLEKTIELKHTGQDTYESVHCPLWTWPNTPIVPGGTLMTLAATAAYKTVGSDFAIDTLHTFFLAGSKADLPLTLKVQRLTDGGRFVNRTIKIEQTGKIIAHLTCSFVRTSAIMGRSMTNSIRRSRTHTRDTIDFDDLETGKNQQGPVMRFERLPLAYTGRTPIPKNPLPESLTYTSIAQVSPPITHSDTNLQALGIITLSDYHILDAAPTLHRLPYGQPEIGDTTRTKLDSEFERFTSLNHTIHFRRHDGFRADDLCYIEVTNPWAASRRAEIRSNIFDRQGVLIATCKQEAYYQMKEEKESKL